MASTNAQQDYPSLNPYSGQSNAGQSNVGAKAAGLKDSAVTSQVSTAIHK